MRFAIAFCAATLAAVLCQTIQGGDISGRITNPDKCEGVSALHRGGTVTRLVLKETKGRFDPNTGEFSIPNLPDARYVLRVHLKGGGWIDGARMSLQADEQSDEKLTEEDREQIQDFVRNYPDRFSDVLRPVRIEGNGRFARVLMEEIRHRDYHSGTGGDIIWRMEVWKFEKQTGTWVRSQHGWEVLSRERISDKAGRTMDHAAFAKLTWAFDPRLAGFDITDGKSFSGVTYAIPDKVDMAMGKAPGSVEKQIQEDRERLRKKQEEEGLK